MSAYWHLMNKSVLPVFVRFWIADILVVRLDISGCLIGRGERRDMCGWERIESPIHRAYHLIGLLTGARPGELARLKWSDVRPRQRSLVIAHAKAGADIAVPMSIEIVKALRMARDAGDEGEELVFPGCAQVGHRDKLPARGNMLRHTFRTVCADLGVDELLAHFLMGMRRKASRKDI